MSASRLTIAFSTLGCPEWDAWTVVERAHRYDYDLIEWRGGPDGTIGVDWSAARRRALREAMDGVGVGALAVTAYTDFISADPRRRDESVDDLRRHLDLAAEIGAPFVRAFVGTPSDPAPADELTARAVDALLAAADHARRVGVDIAVEPHDAHVRSETVMPILRQVGHESVGVVWDIGNAWAAGERPDVGLSELGPFIRYVQVKDGVGSGSAWRLVPLGDGDAPLGDALERLVGRFGPGAVPPISFEWERAWFPDLDPPDRALPAAAAWLRGGGRRHHQGSPGA